MLKDDILTIIQLYWPNEGWINRAEIAGALGRPHKFLETRDIWVLRELVTDGLIISRHVPYAKNPENTFVQYKAVEK